MIIKDNLKKTIQDTLLEEKKDAFHINLITHSCGGKGLNISFVTKDEIKRLITVNDVPVDIEEEDEKFLEFVAFDCDDNGNITLEFLEGFKSPCHGCSDCD